MTNQLPCCNKQKCECTSCYPGKCVKNTPALTQLPDDYPKNMRNKRSRETKALVEKLEAEDCSCNKGTLEVLYHQLYIFSNGKKGMKLGSGKKAPFDACYCRHPIPLPNLKPSDKAREVNHKCCSC